MYVFSAVSRAFAACIVVTISATGDGNDFAGFLLRAENSVGTFSVSSDDARTECSVDYLLVHLVQMQLRYYLRHRLAGVMLCTAFVCLSVC